jgi:hypothetical protein
MYWLGDPAFDSQYEQIIFLFFKTPISNVGLTYPLLLRVSDLVSSWVK